MDAQSWGGTITSSDHKLVTADFILKVKAAYPLRFHTRQRTPPAQKLARDRLLHNDDSRTEYMEALFRTLTTDSLADDTPTSRRWEETFQRVHQAAEATIGYTCTATRRRRYDDRILADLSDKQRALRLKIYNDTATNTTELRHQRNALLHQLRTRCRELASQALDEKVSRIENLSGTAQMYEAVRDINHKRSPPLMLRDPTGKYILRHRTTNQLVRVHFRAQFPHPACLPVTPDGDARALTCPISADEVRHAFRRLNNGRASGPDDIPAELLKYGADVLAPRVADLLNQSFARGEPIELGEGTLLGLPKPNKPDGECSSLRPIVLLNSIREAVSLVVLRRISPAVDKYLSPHQSGFRPSRSTADAVWAHKWLCVRAQRYQEAIHILGIDLSRAFDTIDRTKLLDVLATFLQDDELRLIRLVLSNTTLSLRAGHHVLSPFASNIGTPQGESLSPVLFVIYLEAALRDLASQPEMPQDHLQQMIVYADDADFICRDPKVLQLIQERAPGVLARWSLKMNTSKTEITSICRHTSPAGHNRLTRAAEEQWHSTKKLDSLLGDTEDLSRRKSLAAAALRCLWSIWKRSHYTTDETRVRLYNCYVLPILLYNCATWALTRTELLGLESFHRRQLRSVLNVRYPRRISNSQLYETCKERPLRHRVATAR